VVAHDAPADDGRAGLGKAPTDPAGVGVDDVAHQQFVTDRDDGDAGSGAHP
jgi:hypothetical protein